MGKYLTKEEYIAKFIAAIKKCDKGLVYDIDEDYSDIDEEYGIYFDFSYQIDDRKSNRGNDETVENLLQKELGDEFHVSLNRVDAFPNGYAAYNISISSASEENGNVSLFESIIGMDLKNAEKFVESVKYDEDENYNLRVVILDGKSLFVTQELSPNRLNVEVDKNIVINIDGIY